MSEVAISFEIHSALQLGRRAVPDVVDEVKAQMAGVSTLAVHSVINELQIERKVYIENGELFNAKGVVNAPFVTPRSEDIPVKVDAIISTRKAAKQGDIVSDLIVNYGYVNNKDLRSSVRQHLTEGTYHGHLTKKDHAYSIAHIKTRKGGAGGRKKSAAK